MKLDAEYKEDKLASLQRELEDFQAGGASEDEVKVLKKQKADLEMRLKDQVWSTLHDHELIVA